jgi:L-ascorbate metabolism protein UlaG (beta-lactamase superfamily)
MGSLVQPLEVNATYIGGPTLLLEVAGLRLLTDPTFDPAGSSYPAGGIVLRKRSGPALAVEDLGPIDAVLLSHDHHFDNLDHAGRLLLAKVPAIFTTESGASRLGAGATGLAPWASAPLATPSGEALRITATPARHGPAGFEHASGEVIGFLVSLGAGGGGRALAYITGDTVWYEGIAEVSRRSDPSAVFLHGGAAQPRGPFNMTMNTNDAIETARAFPRARIIPLHHEGWEHNTQDAGDLATAFAAVGMRERLQVLAPGVAVRLAL